MIRVKRAVFRLDAEKVMRAARRGSEDPLMDAGQMVEDEAKRSMGRGGRSGPPAVRSGNLRDSIGHAKTGRGTVIVGPTDDAPYGRVLEFGGRNQPKRAFMWPALKVASRNFVGLWRGSVR